MQSPGLAKFSVYVHTELIASVTWNFMPPNSLNPLNKKRIVESIYVYIYIKRERLHGSAEARRWIGYGCET